MPARFAGLRASENLGLAIPLRISGKDTAGRAFEESAQTTLINPLGGKLLTAQQLSEGAVLTVTVLATKKRTEARVIWIGEKVEKRYEVAVEMENAGDLWGVQFPSDLAASKSGSVARAQRPSAPPPPPAPPAAAAARESSASVARAQRPSPPPPAPPAAAAARESSTPGDMLAETVKTVVENAVESSLRPAIERLSRESEEKIVRAQVASVQGAQEKIAAATSLQSERLEMRALDIVTRNVHVLEQNIQEFIDSSEQAMKRRQLELAEQVGEAARNQLLEVALSGKARIQQESADAVSAACTTLRHAIQQELPHLENQFAEQCRSRTERLLSCHVEEAGNALAHGVREAEDELSRQLGLLATRFTAQLEQRCTQALADAAAGIEKRLEETAERVGQSFLRHIVTELDQKHVEFTERTLRSIEEAAEQTLRRTRGELARIMKGLGEAIS